MKTYALRLEDASAVIGHLAGPGLSKQDVHTAYTAFVQELIDALARCSAEPVDIETHDFKELENYKLQKYDKNKKYLNFDSQRPLGIDLGVSRRFDLKTGDQLGITSRPGYDELSDQIARIKFEHGTSFGVIEDDIYTGGTLLHMIELLQASGIEVHSIISGISSTKRLGSLPVLAAVYYDPSELLELTDPRDYIFGASNGGLVVSHAGIKCRVPYCLPFCDVGKRSSIAKHRAEEFSKLVIAANRRLHHTLGSLSLPAALFYPKSMLGFVGLAESDSLKDAFKKLYDR